MILGCTGHRCDKLPDKKTGYTLPNPTYIKVCQEIEKHLLELKPEKVISGMALGSDQYVAHIAIKLGIPVIGAIPFLGQESVWTQKQQRVYHRLLAKTAEQVIVSEGGYAAYKMQVRNQWIVDHCDLLLAIWNGTSGGTANCISYAKYQNKTIVYIDPRLN